MHGDHRGYAGFGHPSLTSSTHNSRYTSSLTPPFNGVLHTSHWSLLSVVRFGTVALPSVGTRTCDGHFYHIWPVRRFKGIWQGNFLAKFNLDVINFLKFTSIEFILLNVVNDIHNLCLQLQTPCLLEVLTYVIS